MKDLESLKREVAQMSTTALEMLETTHRAFMEHDTDLISVALEHENKLNTMEKSIVADLIALGRSCGNKEERLKATLYTDVVGDLELIGDYSKDILERTQIKIEEKLLFSDEAVIEYNHLYELALSAFREIVEALNKDKPELVKDVLKDQQHIDKLVDAYRNKHNQRMIDGVCSPISCNMFLNMLDFTAAIYYHVKKITRSLLKIKK